MFAALRQCMSERRGYVVILWDSEVENVRLSLQPVRLE